MSRRLPEPIPPAPPKGYSGPAPAKASIPFAERICGNCRFMTLGNGLLPSQCHRYPPDIVINLAGAAAAWRPVKADDWCGEWSSKELS